jgi:hypothetical protein
VRARRHLHHRGIVGEALVQAPDEGHAPKLQGGVQQMIVWLMALTGLTGGEDAGPGATDCLSLDHEIERLAASGAQGASGPRIGGVFKLNYSNSDEFVPPGSTNELGGFVFDNLRLSVEGRAGDFDYLIQYEAAIAGQASTPIDLDAWVRTELGEHVRVTIGNQLRPVLASALVEPEGMLFVLRTTDGQFWHARDLAVKLDGAYDNGLAWALSVENGGDGQGDVLAWTARVDYHALGGGVGPFEGAFEAGDETRLSLGAAYHDDASAADDGEVVALDARVSHDRLWAQAEWLDYADDGGAGTGLYSVFSDTRPWSAALSYMLVEDRYEAAVRYQDLDDPIDTRAITIGVNRYEHGRDAMWQLDFVDVSADSPGIDTRTVALGLTIHI